MVEGMTVRERVYDALFKQPGKTATVVELTELFKGKLDRKQIMNALQGMTIENEPRVERRERGAYAAIEDADPDAIERRDYPPHSELLDEEDETPRRKYAPPGEDAIENGRVRRVRKHMKDLDGTLDDLDRYITKLQAKARAYDKIQMAMNGVVVDPL